MTRLRGFSLVEVMLATALLATGIGLAFATFANATQATERAEALAQRNERLRAVQSFLRRQVEGALPLPYEFTEATGEATVFECDGQTLRLVASMPGYLSRGGPHVQTFSLVRGEGGLRLEFTHQLLTPDGPLEAERKPEVLIDGIAEGTFEVRTLDDDGKPGNWSDDWRQIDQFPRLVRLQLRMRDERAQWPELVTAPRLVQTPLPSPRGLDQP
ncbi:MAG: prepilin-type N-terminal cleavage/methylation domain-containing protein [Arenimonas sp.]|uniref:prepilin-type N-terminal cleavage/methylation domain-containing protein n=1 Tax=Arenimonas sp. TaxID=1872635 RepID=UPI0025BEDF65|nr:prepilin-type N-terminal cleavage/methylation domain-containing protein [Arenimonas sp.]MBW8368528.1 prepilin-type N-terminal cleavage/methylation domain-containing protein [Arenimonas sp.]